MGIQTQSRKKKKERLLQVPKRAQLSVQRKANARCFQLRLDRCAIAMKLPAHLRLSWRTADSNLTRKPYLKVRRRQATCPIMNKRKGKRRKSQSSRAGRALAIKT